jgi:hypothetical protein
VYEKTQIEKRMKNGSISAEKLSGLSWKIKLFLISNFSSLRKFPNWALGKRSNPEC